MCDKIIKILLLSVVFFGFGMVNLYAAQYSIDTSNVSNGTITVNTDQTDKKVKVIIEKEGQSYSYNLSQSNINTFPLQMGTGVYHITVYENLHDDIYRPVETRELVIGKINTENMYTSPIQLIDFSSAMTTIRAFNALVGPDGTDEDKFHAFHDEIVSTVAYDQEKAQSLPVNYLPVIDEIYLDGKGICYDYSALLAAVLRENGIQTKLQMGYTDLIPEYHAWNEVYLDGSWFKVDCTYDAQSKMVGVHFAIKKDDDAYKVVKEY